MELIKKTAFEVINLLRSGDITTFDCLESLEKRTSDINLKVNALTTLCFDRARKSALQIEKLPFSERGVLAGLPLPIKDLVDVSDVKSTRGSTIFMNNTPKVSDFIVKNIERNGGIVFAMTNTPEFGAGANTFNELFGATLNPWNTSLSCAGSSGGAAVALATGMAWVAHGSDMGGSLRNPASFCSVVGMRPSPGRVSSTIFNQMDETLGVNGPMARNIKDLSLIFDAMVGRNYDDPLSLPKENTTFYNQATSGWKPKRIAFSCDLGLPPVDKTVKDIVLNVAKKLENHGVVVEENHPNLIDAPNCFQVLRSLSFFINLKDLYNDHKDQLKPEIVWNIEKGMNLTSEQISTAEKQRVKILKNTQTFFQKYDLLLCPATIVPPFPVGERYVSQCEGHQFETYIDWLNIVSAITLTCCPALSLPAGFTEDHLPVGIQIVAANRDEGKLLSGSAFIEELLNIKQKLPIDPKTR